MSLTASKQKIFDCISEMLVEQEFKNAQIEFYEANCHHFESEEENKHIYHTIFSEYEGILEKAIEGKLHQNFPEEQIVEFLEGLENDYKLYKDQETITQLKCFTDFEKFKVLMLDYNTKNQQKLGRDDEKKHEIKNQGGIDASVFQKYYETDLSKWKTVIKGKNADDLFIYTLPFENTGIDVARSKWVLKGVSLKAVVKAIMEKDYEKKMKVDKTLKDYKLVKSYGKHDKVMYMQMNIPFMSARDMLLHQFVQEEKDHTKVCVHSVQMNEIPENKDIIRAEMFSNYILRIVPGTNDTQMESVDFFNMKGYIPKMFMNMMMAKMGKEQIAQLYNNAKEEEAKLQK